MNNFPPLATHIGTASLMTRKSRVGPDDDDEEDDVPEHIAGPHDDGDDENGDDDDNVAMFATLQEL